MKMLMYLSSLLLLSASNAVSDERPRSDERGANSLPADQPTTYLASIVDLPLGEGDAVESFSLETWGVRFDAVCHFPDGWRIRAGSSLTPQGVLEGEGSQGVTWPRETNPDVFRNLVLLTLDGPVQLESLKEPDGQVWRPATFEGRVRVMGPDDERDIPLTAANVRLVPAQACR